MTNSLRKILIILTIFLLIAAIALWLGGYLLSKPARITIGDPPRDLSAQNVEVEVAPGMRLRGWYAPGNPTNAQVLLLHGIRGNRTSMLDRARFLHRAGYGAWLFDLRAHGESDGDQITFGARESSDVVAVVNHIKHRFPSQKLAVIGVSLGGASTLLAAERISLDALIIESVYPTIEQAISDRLTMRLGSFGAMVTPLLTMQLEPRIGYSADHLRPIDHIGQIAAPIFVISGSKDLHTNSEETRSLYAKARLPKQLWEVPDATHVDLHHFDQKHYEEKVLEFLARATGIQ